MRRAKIADMVVFVSDPKEDAAAIVTAVDDDGKVDLKVFYKNNHEARKWAIEYGFNEGQFHFPGESLA